MRVPADDAVKAAVVNQGVLQLHFVAMMQRNLEYFIVCFGESAMDFAVLLFSRPFLEEFIIAVPFAEDSDESTVEHFELGNYKGRGVLASMQHKT
jgi:hypothetical protein